MVFVKKVINTTYIVPGVHAAIEVLLLHFFEAPTWLEGLYISPRATG